MYTTAFGAKKQSNVPFYDPVLLYMPRQYILGHVFEESFKNTFFLTEIQKFILKYWSYYKHIYVLILYNFL